MKINLTLEIEGTEKHLDEILDNLEIASAEREGIAIRTAGGLFVADVIDVAEAP
jgi:hypothetical protein